MSASQDEIPPPPPPPPSSSQTPTQQTPQNSSTIQSANSSKGRILNLAMKMEHYLWPIHTIQSGGYTKWNGPVSITTDTSGQIKVLPPRTAEEIVARERERKARTTLLMALPEDHLAKFHKMTDAKEVVGMPVKSRFGENDESKKDSKFQSLLSQLEIHGAGVSTEDANKKFLRSLPSAWSQVSLIMRTKPGVDSLSFDDLYNNLRVFESDIKGSTASSSSPQNVAFVSENSSNTNEVSTGLIGLTFRRWRRLSFDGLHSSRLRHRGNFMFLDKCKESNAKSKKLYDAQREQLSDASIEIKAYSQGLKQGCQDRDPTWDRFCLCKIEILVNASKAKKVEKSHDPLALVAHTVSSSKTITPYYVTHPSSVVDYDDDYQGDAVLNNSNDPLTSAMILLARAITQHFSNPTNSHLRTSPNTRNQAIVQGGRVNILSRNSSNDARNTRCSYVQEEVIESTNVQNDARNIQRTLQTASSRTTLSKMFQC
ncbi:hypothetical protein Tco_1132524 [Tanacetum coccineum]|uniref:Uncharacterized protein n=1 Tax=Tanacetum coccineum TaxID=301880 RepID=A0ABQ5JF65_9ASTR